MNVHILKRQPYLRPTERVCDMCTAEAMEKPQGIVNWVAMQDDSVKVVTIFTPGVGTDHFTLCPRHIAELSAS